MIKLTQSWSWKHQKELGGINMEKIEIKGINIAALEELNLAVQRGMTIFEKGRETRRIAREMEKDKLAQLRDTTINKVIDLSIEEMKREEYLTQTIRELDFQELKKLDAVLYRGPSSSPLDIKPLDLSEQAVNLYVSIARGTYLKTIATCASVYDSKQLDSLSSSYKEFNQNLTEAYGNKTKKFNLAANLMKTLRQSSKSKIEDISIIKK